MKHPVYDTDKHFTVDPVTGVLSTEMKKITLVKRTHNSERFTFKFPRTVEGHDLSLCDKAEVHFLNIDAITKETSKGTYKIEDVQAGEEDVETITFSWLIDGRATEYVGTLHFSIHFKCEEAGKLLYRWPTATFSNVQITDGVDNGDVAMEEYKDIVTEWMHEIEQSIDGTVSKAVDDLVGDAVDKAVEETVGDAVNKAIEDTLDQANLANAIKANVSGTSITIDDLSPLTPKLKVKVVGKQPPEVPAMMMMRSATPAATGGEFVNLIPFTRDDGYIGYKDAVVRKSVTNNGITYKVNNDGSITMVGVASDLSTFILYESENNLAFFETGKYYTLYKGGTDKYNVFVKYFNSDTSTFTVFLLGDGSSAILPASASCIQILLTVTKSKTISDSVTFYPMIVEGRNVDITSYEPPQGANADGGDHTHIDADEDHFCDLCGERLSACVDNNSDGFCDYCGASTHTCADNNNDHLCDICGKVLTECADDNNDHLCDICGKVLSECEDPDLDHDCDHCGAIMGRHWDDTQDHLCDYCGEVVTDHVDEDMNHVCDVCGHVMGEHKDNGKGFCDYCGASMHDCVDSDEDGLCDICGVDIHICADDDNDHRCDHCGKVLSECVDNEPKDHKCDICGKVLSECEDNDPKDHKCDYCGGTGFGVHADEDGDGLCDYCGEPIIAVTLKIASADDPDNIIKTIKTTYGAIVELTPIFPSMVIATDKDDAILLAEYNKDTNAVIAELREAIGEGGGGVTDADKEEIKEEIKAYVDDAILGGAW